MKFPSVSKYNSTYKIFFFRVNTKFSYSILKNFSFFYNKFYFKPFTNLKVNADKFFSKLNKKFFFIKKWLFFTKIFNSIALKSFFLKNKWISFLKKDFWDFKSFIFAYIFKRLNNKIFKNILKNPLTLYQHFSFKIVKIIASLKIYKLYNRKYKKKAFDLKIFKKLFAFFKNLKNSKINLFLKFLNSIIIWVKSKKKNFYKKNSILKKKLFFFKYKSFKYKSFKYKSFKYKSFKNKNICLQVTKIKSFINPFLPVYKYLKKKKYLFKFNNFSLKVDRKKKLLNISINYKLKKYLIKAYLKEKQFLKKQFLKKKYSIKAYLKEKQFLKKKYSIKTIFKKKIPLKYSLLIKYFSRSLKRRSHLKKRYIKNFLYRFNLFKYKKSLIKIINSIKGVTKIQKIKKFFFYFKKQKTFTKIKVNSNYYLSPSFFKNFSVKFLYQFFFKRQNLKFLNHFKFFNLSSINALKKYQLKNFYLALAKNKKNLKSQVREKDFLKPFRKYQSFQKFKSLTFNIIPKFFLSKKKWKKRNEKFKINRFLLRLFRFQKSRKKKVYENNFKRYGNYRRYFSRRSKYLWDRRMFLSYKNEHNPNLEYFDSKKLNFFFKNILKISVLNIFYSLLKKFKKNNIKIFFLFLQKKNIIHFLKKKLLKKCIFLIRTSINIFFFRLYRKKIIFKNLSKKIFLIKNSILLWFLYKNFTKKKEILLKIKNSLFYLTLKSKFKIYFFKFFFKVNYIWNYFFFRSKSKYFLKIKNNISFKCLFFKLKNYFFYILNFKSFRIFFKTFFFFPDFLFNTRKFKILRSKYNFLNIKFKFLQINKFFSEKKKLIIFSLVDSKKNFNKFFCFDKEKYFFLKYRWFKFSPSGSIWGKTKNFFYKLCLSTYEFYFACKESYKFNFFNLFQIFYTLKFASNLDALQDLDFQKRKTFSLRRFNTRDRRSFFKRFLTIHKFSKIFYLFKRFFKYLKILKKVKNQFFFKKKKFNKFFFYRLDICLFDTKFFGTLKTVRQLINLNYIYLNMKISDKPNCFLNVLDLVTVCKKANLWLCLMFKNTKLFKNSLGWPIYQWAFKEKFLTFYKNLKNWYDFKFNSRGLGLIIISNLKFKFRKFKKDSIFSKNLTLHRKQISFILNCIKR